MHERFCAWTYLCMIVHVHERTCAWTYLCMNVHVHERTCAWSNLCMIVTVHERPCAGMYICMQVQMHECTCNDSTCEWTFLCMNVHVHEHTCAWTYMCINIPLHEHTCVWAYLCMNACRSLRQLQGGGEDVMVKTMRKVVFSPPYLSLRGLYWLNPNLHNMAVVQELKPHICVSSTKHFNVPFYLMSEIILDRKLRAYFTGSPSRVPRVRGVSISFNCLKLECFF